MYRNRSIGVVIPALDEAASVGTVVSELRALHVDGQPVVDHLIVCDNGSFDDTAQRARAAGATVVSELRKGYGSACLAALAALPPVDAVVFADADGSVVTTELERLLERWQQGANLVIGSRTLGEAAPGALSPQQRWGNQLASFLLRTIWREPVTDLGPFRLIDHTSLTQLQMTDPAYGWTVEMQIKAIQQQLLVAEVPVTTRQRIGKSKISGTLLGTIGASIGILGTIARYSWSGSVPGSGALGNERSGDRSLSR